MRFPSPLSHLIQQPQQRSVAIVLAFTGVVLPIAGLHKFYLRQPAWGIAYLLLSWTPIPHVAAAIEAVWYLVQAENPQFADLPGALTPGTVNVITPANPVSNVTEGIRQLEQLRVDGLITEYEFEQKRRQLLDKI